LDNNGIIHCFGNAFIFINIYRISISLDFSILDRITGLKAYGYCQNSSILSNYFPKLFYQDTLLSAVHLSAPFIEESTGLLYLMTTLRRQRSELSKAPGWIGLVISARKSVKLEDFLFGIVYYFHPSYCHKNSLCYCVW
jgi:hypothetical protein